MPCFGPSMMASKMGPLTSAWADHSTMKLAPDPGPEIAALDQIGGGLQGAEDQGLGSELADQVAVRPEITDVVEPDRVLRVGVSGAQHDIQLHRTAAAGVDV